jgi:hypothetical protein
MQVELLTENDLFFIKKYASGVFFNKIKSDLNITSYEEFYNEKTAIKLKLGITNDLDLIQEAFNIGVLVVDKFILKNINDIVFGVAYNLYMDGERLQFKEDLQDLYVNVYETYLCVLNRYKISSNL